MEQCRSFAGVLPNRNQRRSETALSRLYNPVQKKGEYGYAFMAGRIGEYGPSFRILYGEKKNDSVKVQNTPMVAGLGLHHTYP